MAAPKFGKLHASTGDLVINTDLTENALRLFVWLTRFLKDGDKLTGIESETLNNWLADNASCAKAGDVQVVQFTVGNAANEVFKGQRREFQRQIERLINKGILKPIRAGTRGHASLYLVCNEYTSGCVPNRLSNKYTSGTEKVHIEGEIGTHAEPLTCSDVTYPDNYPDINPSGACLSDVEESEVTPSECPHCHSTNTFPVPEVNNLHECRDCGYTFHARVSGVAHA